MENVHVQKTCKFLYLNVNMKAQKMHVSMSIECLLLPAITS